MADQGFEGGQTIERPDIQIANTKSPDLYRAERYSMDSFSWPVPNGRYLVKLHFAETFEGINGPGERVFSFNVQGHEFKDFDVWVKAGGPLKAYVETVPVEVTNGTIKITFTPNVENPQINAIEIIPQSAAEADAGTSAPAAKTSDITGTWTSEFDSQIGHQKYIFTFKQDGAKLTGKANSEVNDRKREAELKDGKVDGDKISFVEMLSFQDNEIPITYTGKLSANGNEIKFTREVGNFAKEEIVARRQPRAPAESAVAAPPATAHVASVPAPTPVLQIDAGKVAGKVSPRLYGLMTEEINFAYEGGIYGELIRNRTFKSNPRNPDFWDVVGDATMAIDTDHPLNDALNLSLKLDASKASENAPAGIANGGYWGIPVRPDTEYRASFYARAEDFSGPLKLAIESADGKTVFASGEVSKISGDWKKYEVTLNTKNVQPSKDNRFVITTTQPGVVWFQNVSLFPPTYHNRPNGTRPDIMQLLADMKPAFLRFPGGNYLEGSRLADRFNWKETIGDVTQRPGHRSPWGYWSTDGFGLLEFLEWCEDLHMEPVLGIFAGYTLDRKYAEPGPELEPYVQEALEEIEYVTGNTGTKWGARRAADGHPEPFPLNYVEIGNEDWFDRSGSYEGRFAQFYDAIKAKYPHLQVISTMGYEHPTQVVRSRVPDLVDEHYYRGMEDMMAHALDYDNYSRTNKTKIFCGEWATRVGSPTPNMAGALGDAAWMTGMERNSDIVVMECYAPLFVNVSQLTGRNRSMQWSSDLIGYDALTSYGSPAYYAQRMFSTMHGDEILATDSQDIPTRQWQPRAFRGRTPPARQIREVFFDATRDSQSGIIYLKVVNAGAAPQQIKIQIEGAPKIEPEGELVSLRADSLDDTNSIEQPRNVVPRMETADRLGANFTREFPPFSITILKLKSQ